jgi:hypothetical protein
VFKINYHFPNLIKAVNMSKNEWNVLDSAIISSNVKASKILTLKYSNKNPFSQLIGLRVVNADGTETTKGLCLIPFEFQFFCRVLKYAKDKHIRLEDNTCARVLLIKPKFKTGDTEVIHTVENQTIKLKLNKTECLKIIDAHKIWATRCDC